MEQNAGFSTPISVRLLGDFQIIRADGVVLRSPDLGGCKTRLILEILLLQLGTPVSKDRLIELLWGGHAPDGAVATVESYVSGLRRTIQPGHTRTGPLRTSNGGYVLDSALVDLDLARFHRLIRRADRCQNAEAYRLLLQSLEIGSSPLLSHELTSEWAESERTSQAATVQEIQVRVSELATILGKTGEAIRWAQTAVTADCLNERAWTALVTAFEGASLYTEGLSAYERCRRLFGRELGCVPGPSLRAAHLRLLRQTAEEESELAEVLNALLYLGARLNLVSGIGFSGGGRDLSSEGAGQILDSFLRRARTAT